MLLGLMFFSARAILPAIAEEQYRLITKETVLRIENQISLIMEEIQELAIKVQNSRSLQSRDVDKIKAELVEIVYTYPFIDKGIVLDKNGMVLGTYPQDIRRMHKTNQSHNEYFQQAIITKDVFISNLTSIDTGHFVINISVPLMNRQQEVEYVLNFELNMEENQLFQSIFQSVNIGNNGYTFIVDKNGSIISHPQRERIGDNVRANPVIAKAINKQSGYQLVTNTKGVDMYASYQYAPDLGWGIVAQVPVEEIYHSFDSFSKYFYVISFILITILSIVTAFYSRQIIKPIQTLYMAIDQVAKGDYSQRIDKVERSEIGKLTNRFNEMIEYVGKARLSIKSKEEEVWKQKEFLWKIIDMNPNFIYALDRDGYITLANQSLADLFGTTPQQMFGKKAASFNLHYDEEEDIDLLNTRKGKLIPENIIKDKEGQVHWLQIVKLPIPSFSDRKEQILYVCTDTTERKKTEEYIRKSEKLSVVGELAAGVAHEIRNPLTSIKGFIQLLESMDAKGKFYYEVMLSEIERINFIVNEFMVLAKPQVVRFELKDLNLMLQGVITLLRTQAIMQDVQIIDEFDQDIPPIYCDENQLKQVFINVIKNSIESMPTGGKLYIQSKMHNERHVMIRFVDQGCGIPRERIPKLGEPFYTTKEKGTGLGLMVSHKIIEAHKGTIHFESELEEGTTVDIILPFKIDSSS
jgi:two-component system sporulation sensor kinase A